MAPKNRSVKPAPRQFHIGFPRDLAPGEYTARVDKVTVGQDRNVYVQWTDVERRPDGVMVARLLGHCLREVPSPFANAKPVSFDEHLALKARVAALEAKEYDAEGALTKFWDYVAHIHDSSVVQYAMDVDLIDCGLWSSSAGVPIGFRFDDPDWLGVLHQILARTGVLVEDAA